jgi:hypothetical protein
MRVIEIQEEIRIPQEDQDLILEKGDKIKIIKEAKKISKKDFDSMHKAGELGLVSGMIRQDSEVVFNIIKKAGEDFVNNTMKTIPASKAETHSQLGVGVTITIYSETIFGKEFIAVETKADYSKDPHASWDTINFYTTLYVKIK